ncbi:IclR family transcriptional regulator [Falsirhodobacter halotolerans]|uniref:IclR family transcriptional regulator n=1 Tax=Falsirhodobacter halotolerans TaxID=1146892 RepID=UPI001FD2FD51|nr:IclR family transcriptional regulator C-terminal domain-containing protein [Falsirhodobacter halotolerans]MCJ8141013.1 helix-turn-helix domain-containing protein [Falsirhodobacter halotolerans]
MTDEKDDPLMVRAVEKAFRILSTFDAANSRQTLTQLASKAGLDRSATQRFTHTLSRLGYLRKDTRTKAYELTPKTLNLAYQYTRSSPVVLRAHPYLSHLNRTTEETISLTVLDDTEIIYLSRYLSPNVLDTDVIVGSRLPAYCSAGGLALLSLLDDARIEDILDRSNLRAFTSKTVFDRPGIWDRIHLVRDRGFALVEEQIYSGDISIAAPITMPDGQAMAAVSLGASRFRYQEEAMMQRFVPTLVAAARSMSQAIQI